LTPMMARWPGVAVREVAACVRWGEGYDGRAFRDSSASAPLRIFERGFS
jgi:hypothetical protein